MLRVRSRDAASRLVGGLLLMPGRRGTCTAATLTVDGFRFDRLQLTTADARRVVDRLRALTASAHETPSGLLARETADCLLTAERQLRRGDGVYRFIPRASAISLEPRRLPALAETCAAHR